MLISLLPTKHTNIVKTRYKYEFQYSSKFQFIKIPSGSHFCIDLVSCWVHVLVIMTRDSQHQVYLAVEWIELNVNCLAYLFVSIQHKKQANKICQQKTCTFHNTMLLLVLIKVKTSSSFSLGDCQTTYNMLPQKHCYNSKIVK